MGLLDRLKSFVGTAATPAVDMRGPLRLAAGDGIGWYRERFVVTGSRRLVYEGHVVWHHCLRDVDGNRSVLVHEEGPDGNLWLQRLIAPDLPWDSDTLDDVGDEPFRLTHRGSAQADQTGETGTSGVRAVAFREFEDPEGDRVIVLEDWDGVREARVGETVHEAELQFVRASESADGAVFPDEDEAVTHSKAADALAGRHGEDADSAGTDEDVGREDVDPTAYDDEEWDERDGEAPIGASAPMVEALVDSEDDEWLAATRFIREFGLPADGRPR